VKPSDRRDLSPPSVDRAFSHFSGGGSCSVHSPDSRMAPRRLPREMLKETRSARSGSESARVVEIRDEPRLLCRAPSQPLPRQRA